MMKRRREQKICGKSVVGASANFVQKNNNFVQKNNSHKSKKKTTKQTTTFKKKKRKCYVCESPNHFVGKCPLRKGVKSTNMVISKVGGTSGYGNLLPTVLSVFYLPEWWVDTGANIHVCVIFSYFLLTRSEGLPPC
jgi:hypothetical protein